MALDDAQLEGILDRVQEWIRAADIKAEILGATQTATAALLADNVSRWFAPGTSGFLKAGMAIALGLWLVSLVTTVFAILAVTDNPHQQSVTFFGDITKWKSLEKYRNAVDGIDEPTLRNDYIDQIYICSTICGDKHWYIKRAMWLFVFSLVAVEATLILNGFLG